jgi:hypothetical protein
VNVFVPVVTIWPVVPVSLPVMLYLAASPPVTPLMTSLVPAAHVLGRALEVVAIAVETEPPEGVLAPVE